MKEKWLENRQNLGSYHKAILTEVDAYFARVEGNDNAQIRRAKATVEGASKDVLPFTIVIAALRFISTVRGVYRARQQKYNLEEHEKPIRDLLDRYKTAVYLVLS